MVATSDWSQRFSKVESSEPLFLQDTAASCLESLVLPPHLLLEDFLPCRSGCPFSVSIHFLIFPFSSYCSALYLRVCWGLPNYWKGHSRGPYPFVLCLRCPVQHLLHNMWPIIGSICAGSEFWMETVSSVICKTAPEISHDHLLLRDALLSCIFMT